MLPLVAVVEVVVVVVVAVVVDARSNVVESTANSVGEPTRSKAPPNDELLDAGPEPIELPVEVTLDANLGISFVCFCWC